MPKLLVLNGERKGFVFRFNDQKLGIGRDPSNALMIPDRRVSRFHASVYPRDQQWWIEDVGSVNGTLVNGRPVNTQILNYSDEIRLGSTILKFVQSNAPEIEDSNSHTQVRVISDKDSSSKVNIELALRSSPDVFEEKALPADTGELAALYKRLLIIYRVSLDLGVVSDLRTLCSRILESVLGVIKADRGFIMLRDEESGQLVLQAVYKKPGLQEDDEISFSHTVCEQVMNSGESLMISDAGQDSRFKEAQSIVLQGIRSTMCVPIKSKDRVLGILYVDTKGKVISFRKEDLEMLTALSHQAAVAIENARLFQDLQQANSELKSQQSQLIEAEKLSALGKLAGGVAHEINNPMTSILGYSQLISQQLNSDDHGPDKLKECAEFSAIVESEALRCQSIVQTLLQFGRRKKEVMALIDINQPVEAALMIAKFHIKKTRVEIKKELQPGLAHIMGDANQLQQVFLNLIINARDAMENNGGTLTIITEKSGDKEVSAKFIDTGCGIPEDKLEEIFKPLYTTKEEGKGTGLGLSITQDIVERHKGKIEVESRVGKGTTFTIRLPVTA